MRIKKIIPIYLFLSLSLISQSAQSDLSFIGKYLTAGKPIADIERNKRMAKILYPITIKAREARIKSYQVSKNIPNKKEYELKDKKFFLNLTKELKQNSNRRKL